MTESTAKSLVGSPTQMKKKIVQNGGYISTRKINYIHELQT